MICSIEFSNYKSFREKTRVEIRPITIFVGPNSSGKSAILRLLALLGQSVQSPRQGQLLCFKGPTIDMGAMASCLPFNEKLKLEIGIEMGVNYNAGLSIGKRNEALTPVKISVVNDGKNDRFNFECDNHQITLRSENDYNHRQGWCWRLAVSIESIENAIASMNLEDATKAISIFNEFVSENRQISLFSLVAGTMMKGESGSNNAFNGLKFDNCSIGINWSRGAENECTEQLDSLLGVVFFGESPKDEDSERCDHYVKLKSMELLDRYQYVLSEVKFADYREAILDRLGSIIENNVADELNKKVFSRINTFIHEKVEVAISQNIGNIQYLGPIRKAPQRIYTLEDIQSMGLNDLNREYRNFITPRHPVTKEPMDIDYWLTHLGLPYALTVNEIKSGISNSEMFEIILENKGTHFKQCLSDVGFGASQIISIILALTGNDNTLFLVEQPELHLHPKAQSKLANLIYASAKMLNNNLILETHSEHLIKKLQILVAKRALHPDDLSIYYVNKNAKEESEIAELRMDERGYFMDEWPEDFFDLGYKAGMELLGAQIK